MEKSLVEIYNKYLVMEKIENDPVSALIPATLINNINYYLRDFRINFSGSRKLWKPGIPIIPVEETRFDCFEMYILSRATLTVNDLVWSQDLVNLFYSEFIEKEYGITNYWEDIYSTDDFYRYAKEFSEYMLTQKLYVYYMPSFLKFTKTPKVEELYRNLEGNDNEFRNISGKKVYKSSQSVIAFSEDMLKEQFNLYKKKSIDNLSTEIRKIENRINCYTKSIKRDKDKLDILLDKLFIEEERLDELFKI